MAFSADLTCNLSLIVTAGKIDSASDRLVGLVVMASACGGMFFGIESYQ